MDSLDYKKIYGTQDKALAIVFGVENEFYLTGGTCLSRFYKAKRYSDDLDLFTNSSSRYSFAVKNIKFALQREFTLNVEVESKDFIRFKLNDVLQIDFINDISSRYKDVIVLENGFIIDNIENILSNKLTAVMGRDNPKDVFDIYLIAKYYSFHWKDILDSAHKKAGFSDDDLIIRLKSFPSELFSKINLIDKKFLNHFEEEFPKIISEINNGLTHNAIAQER